eukprot:1184327-Prorocentrum_minimum.AAC.1
MVYVFLHNKTSETLSRLRSLDRVTDGELVEHCLGAWGHYSEGGRGKRDFEEEAAPSGPHIQVAVGGKPDPVVRQQDRVIGPLLRQRGGQHEDLPITRRKEGWCA